MSTDSLGPQFQTLVDPARGEDFASLTHQGQMYYVDRRGEGDDHDRAFANAKHSYGLRRA